MSGANKATKKPIDRPAPEVEPKPAPAAKSGIDIELWRKSMERLQRLFERAALMQGRLTSFVIVAPTRAEDRPECRLLGFHDRPPELRDAGETCAEAMGYLSEVPGSANITQTWHCHFVGDGRAMEQLVGLAADATKLLRDLSDGANEWPGRPVCLPGLPLNARNKEKIEVLLFGLDGWQDAGRWMLWVHELAWTHARGSPLHSLRSMWDGDTTMPYYSDEEAWRDLERFGCGGQFGSNLAVKDRVQALRWASIISSDQFAASSHAIEAILAMTQGNGGSRTKPLTPAQGQIWDCLEHQCPMAKEIACELGMSEDCVRRGIGDIRATGREVLNARGRGYYRKDAPPAGFVAP